MLKKQTNKDTTPKFAKVLVSDSRLSLQIDIKNAHTSNRKSVTCLGLKLLGIRGVFGILIILYIWIVVICVFKFCSRIHTYFTIGYSIPVNKY